MPVAFDPSTASSTPVEQPMTAFDPTTIGGDTAPAPKAFDPTTIRPSKITLQPAEGTGRVNTNRLSDDQLNEAAGQYGIEPKLLRALAQKETGFGQSSLYDQATGRSKTKGNNGVSMFQIDPASGLPPDVLERARVDQVYAAHVAAAMLASNIRRFGSTQAGLAAYNAGDPSSPLGQAYAKDVLAHAMTQTDQVKLAGIDAHGLKALGRDILEGPTAWMNKFGAQVGRSEEWARHNPGEALMFFLGAPERAVSSGIAASIEGHWSELGKDIWDGVKHPAEHAHVIATIEHAVLKQMGHGDIDPESLHGIGRFVMDLATETLTDPTAILPVGELISMGAKVARLVGAASHSSHAIEAALKAAGPLAKTKAFQEFAKKIAGTRQDMSKVVDLVKAGQKQFFGIRNDLDTTFTQAGKQARMSLENMAAYSKVERRQEGVNLLDRYKNDLKLAKVGDVLPEEVQEHFLREAYHYGTNADRSAVMELGFKPNAEDMSKFQQAKGWINYGSDEPKLFPGEFEGIHNNWITSVLPKSESYIKSMDGEGQDALRFMQSPGKGKISVPFGQAIAKGEIPEGLESVNLYDLIKNRMDLGNEVIRRQQVAHSTADLAMQYGDKVITQLPKTGLTDKTALADWLAHNVIDKVTGPRGMVGNVAVLDKLSDLMKTGILLNPVPHGIVNVGTALWFHTNPLVAMRGLAYSLAPGAFKVMGANVSPVNWQRKLIGPLIDRLDMGGRTSYWRETTGLGRAAAKILNPMQMALDHFETGMRASLLQHLDKKMAGDISKLGLQPREELAELIKMNAVDHALGGYSHPSKFVQLFKGMGGLYDAFRLGVVPRAGMAALQGRWGLGIGMAERAQQDFDEAFLPSNKRVDVFGPLNDFTKLLFDQFGYFGASSTVGPGIGYVIDQFKDHQSGYHASLTDTLNHIGESIIPGLTPLERAVGDDKTPGWMRLWMEAVGGAYTTSKQKPATVRREARSWRKTATKSRSQQGLHKALKDE